MPTVSFLHTADSHIDTFERLLKDAAPDLRLRHVVSCADAWPLFEAGDRDGFGRAVAAAVTGRVSVLDNPGCAVLAQPSMAARAVLRMFGR